VVANTVLLLTNLFIFEVMCINYRYLLYYYPPTNGIPRSLFIGKLHHSVRSILRQVHDLL